MYEICIKIVKLIFFLFIKSKKTTFYLNLSNNSQYLTNIDYCHFNKTWPKYEFITYLYKRAITANLLIICRSNKYVSHKIRKTLSKVSKKKLLLTRNNNVMSVIIGRNINLLFISIYLEKNE